MSEDWLPDLRYFGSFLPNQRWRDCTRGKKGLLCLLQVLVCSGSPPWPLPRYPCPMLLVTKVIMCSSMSILIPTRRHRARPEFGRPFARHRHRSMRRSYFCLATLTASQRVITGRAWLLGLHVEHCEPISKEFDSLFSDFADKYQDSYARRELRDGCLSKTKPT